MLAKTGTQEAKQISKAKLLKLVKAKDNAKTETSEINGGVGNQVKNLAESDNLDPAAFRIAYQLHRMSPQKLYTTLPALMYYIEQMGLEEKALQAPPLNMGEGEDAEKED